MKRLYRSSTNKIFAGIIGGIGEYLNTGVRNILELAFSEVNFDTNSRREERCVPFVVRERRSNDEFGQNLLALREAKKWLISALRLLGVVHRLRLVRQVLKSSHFFASKSGSNMIPYPLSNYFKVALACDSLGYRSCSWTCCLCNCNFHSA